METILIIYQQYNVHFHLKQDSDLKIHGSVRSDLVLNKTQNFIQADLKDSCRIHFRITPSHFTQNQTMQGENGPKDISFKTTYSNSEWFPMRGLDQVWQMSYFVYV